MTESFRRAILRRFEFEIRVLLVAPRSVKERFDGRIHKTWLACIVDCRRRNPRRHPNRKATTDTNAITTLLSRHKHLAKLLQGTRFVRSGTRHNSVVLGGHLFQSLRTWIRGNKGSGTKPAHLPRIHIAVRECHRRIVLVHNLTRYLANNGRIYVVT